MAETNEEVENKSAPSGLGAEEANAEEANADEMNVLPEDKAAPYSFGLEEQKDKSRVSVIGMIPEMREVTTRKGDRMAIIQLEDLTGACEAVVFPKSYERLCDHLMVETRLLIWASVDRRDDNVQLILEDCREIDDLKFLLIDLHPDQATDINIQHKLRECLSKNRPAKNELGVRIPVVACLKDLSLIHI